MSEKKKPQAFKDLPVEELRRSAVEDFAVPVADTDSAKVVVAALTESGVKWQDYVAQHPEVAPEPNVIKAGPSSPESLSVESAVEVEGDVIVATKPVAKATDKFLIKMTRSNPLYETRGYRFTQEHPYALVNPDDAEFILSNEDGFRQAWPSELEEFYS